MNNIATTSSTTLSDIVSTSTQAVSQLVTASPFDGMTILGTIILIVFVLLVVAIKGYALWYAARRDEKWWFMAMLVINLFGMLELFYLLIVVKRWPKIFNGFGVKSDTNIPE